MTSPIVILNTAYGKMLINKNDINQYGALKATARAIDANNIAMLAQLAGEIKLPCSFVDVGACFGTYTLALAPYFKRVFAFEPQRQLAYCIAGSLVLNDLNYAKVFNIALGSDYAHLSVPQFDYYAPLNFGSIEFGPRQTEVLSQERQYDPERSETVECHRLDDIEDLSGDDLPIGLLKIDAEGMENQILEGAQYLIAEDKPIIFVEFLKAHKHALYQQLRDFGYTNITEHDQNFLALPSKVR